jgi:signal peptidase I
MADNAKAKVKNKAFVWVFIIVLAVLLTALVRYGIIISAIVPSGSMMDTIQPGDMILAFRQSYLLSPPKRFDIVVYRYPDDRSVLHVKRVIGLPGETVDIIAGKVYIDGAAEPLPDHFTKELSKPEDYGPYHMPEDSFFMLGDNRNTSLDSRFWATPYVVKSDILGKALFKYFPGIEFYPSIK